MQTMTGTLANESSTIIQSAIFDHSLFLNGYDASAIQAIPLESFLTQKAAANLRFYGLASLKDLVDAPKGLIAMASNTTSDEVGKAELWAIRNTNPKKPAFDLNDYRPAGANSDMPIGLIATPGVEAKLTKAGYATIASLNNANEVELLQIKGIGSTQLNKLKSRAQKLGIQLTFSAKPRRLCEVNKSTSSFRKAMWLAHVDKYNMGERETPLSASHLSKYQNAFRISKSKSGTLEIPIELTTCKTNLYSMIDHANSLLFANTEQAYRIVHSMSAGAMASFKRYSNNNARIEHQLKTILVANIGSLITILGARKTSDLLIELIEAIKENGGTSLMKEQVNQLVSKCPQYIRHAKLTFFKFKPSITDFPDRYANPTIEQLLYHAKADPVAYCICEEIVDYALICLAAFQEKQCVKRLQSEALIERNNRIDLRCLDIKTRYYLGSNWGITLASLGNEYGITRERVRQITNKEPKKEELLNDIRFNAPRIAICSHLTNNGGQLSIERLMALLREDVLTSGSLRGFLNFDTDIAIDTEREIAILSCIEQYKAKPIGTHRTSNVNGSKPLTEHDCISRMGAPHISKTPPRQIEMDSSNEIRRNEETVTISKSAENATSILAKECARQARRIMKKTRIPLLHISVIYAKHNKALTSRGISARDLYKLMKESKEKTIKMYSYPWVCLVDNYKGDNLPSYIRNAIRSSNGCMSTEEINRIVIKTGASKDNFESLKHCSGLIKDGNNWYEYETAMRHETELISLTNNLSQMLPKGKLSITAEDAFQQERKRLKAIGIHSGRQFFLVLKLIEGRSQLMPAKYPILEKKR